MTSVITSQTREIFYPSSDGAPLAETSIHVDAIINAVVSLRHYLAGQQAFEITSKGTKDEDQGYKKFLYEQLGGLEYWQFDPRGEWIPAQLRGFRLRNESYEPITDGRSDPLKLRLEVEEQLISLYREDTGEKLLAPNDLLQALQQEIAARQEAEVLLEQERQRADAAQAQADRLRAQLQALGIDPDA